MRSAHEMLDMFQAQVWDPEPAGFITQRGLDHSTVSRFGLGYTGGWGAGAEMDVRRPLVIPYEDGLGNLRSVRFRPLRPDWTGPKYWGKEKAHLFAVRALDNHTVYVCEGELDAMILWQCGFKA